MELIEKLKLKYDGEIDDEVAQIYLDDATEYIVDFTRQTSTYVEENLGSVIINIAIEMLSKRGAEGLKSQSYSGASESYNDDISDSLKKRLYSHRRFNHEP